MNWLKRFRPILILMAPSVFLGFMVGALPGYRLYEFTWKDANFCISCHVHDYATVGWKNSVHGQMTTCHDCHHQPLMAYAKEMYIMIKKAPKFPMDLHHTPYVHTELCASCHVSEGVDLSTITGPMGPDKVARVPKIDETKLHQLHLKSKTKFTLLNETPLTEQERSAKPEPLKEFPRTTGPERKIVCADCHGGPANRGHNFSPTNVSCVRCHEKPHAGKIPQTYGCRSCHFQDFLSAPKK